ncbi:MAG: hypothetical protein WD397_14370 [Wenzhouxiangellaceae bacterium]
MLRFAFAGHAPLRAFDKMRLEHRPDQQATTAMGGHACAGDQFAVVKKNGLDLPLAINRVVVYHQPNHLRRAGTSASAAWRVKAAA